MDGWLFLSKFRFQGSFEYFLGFFQNGKMKKTKMKKSERVFVEKELNQLVELTLSLEKELVSVLNSRN